MTSKIKITGVLISSLFIFSINVSAADMSFGKLKSDTCATCHGVEGISPFPLIPNLAGQDADYIVHQLKAFKSGSRLNESMKQISKSLSNDEMITLANYFSRQSIETVDGGDPLLIKKGNDKYSFCWSCHGENGEGPGSYPSVAGQHPQYTIQQLKNFKDGSRKNPAMKALVEVLSADDMEALGAYIATLKP